LPKCSHFEEPIPLADFFNLKEKKVDMQYSILHAISNENANLQGRRLDNQQIDALNRYCDILTYEHSRVVLKRPADTDYINACFVDVSNSFADL